MSNQDELKKLAATAALKFVESGMVVGLGGGSTAALFISELGKSLRRGELRDIVGIPSAKSVGAYALTQGVPLTDLEAQPKLNVSVDGADEVSPQFDLIKGGGGLLTREKIVGQASTRFVIVVDESKCSEVLGQQWPVPVEVVEFGWTTQNDFLLELGAKVVSLRRTADGAMYRTDQGNLILDSNFGPMPFPAKIAAELSSRAGIVEHGLFLGMATDLITSYADRGVVVTSPTKRRHG